MSSQLPIRTVLLLFAVSLQVMAAPQVAPGSEMAPHYPWQTVPERCKGKTPLPDDCRFEDWPDHDEAKAKLTMLYRTEQFLLLERAFEEISSSEKIANTGWPLLTTIFHTVNSWYPSSGFDPEEQMRIARWKKAIPSSRFAPLAEALFLAGKAWSIRGGGYADTVSDESWKLMDRYQRDARKVLLAAPVASRNHPAWHQAMLVIALNLDSREAVELLVEETAARWPIYYPVYEIVAFRLQPKWGASWRDLEHFASKWSTFLAGKRPDGGALYARIYLAVRNEASFDEMKPDWEKLKKSFDVLLSSFPEVHNYKNHFASFACAARDKTTFANAMKLIDKDTLRPNVWIKGHSYEACKEWAFLKA